MVRNIAVILFFVLLSALLAAVGCDRKDNDWPDFDQTIKAIEIDTDLVEVVEGGTAGEYNLSLAMVPTHEVRVAIASDFGEVHVDPDTVVFSVNDWDDVHGVAVTAVDDHLAETARTDTLRHVVISEDTGYRDVAVPDVAVAVTDDDVAAVAVTPVTLQIAESDGAAAETYTVRLLSRPGADVLVVAAVVNPMVRIDPDTLRFEAVTWDLPSTVTVWVQDDGIAEGQHDAVIDHVAVSDDDAYDGLAVPSVQVTITDDGQPTLSLDVPDPVVEADGATIPVTLSLTSPSAFDVSVHLSTHDGTATAGVDYTATDVDITIPAGELGAVQDVLLLNDEVPESTESFTVSLTDAQGATLGVDETTGTILDDDLPGLSVNNVTVMEDGGPAVFRVTLDPVAARDVVFSFHTADNTAVSPSDYLAVAGTDTIHAGDTWLDIPVVIVDNAVSESQETFTVNLSAVPEQAVILDGEGVGTINDDDGSLSVFVADASVTEDDGTAVFALTLSGQSQQDVTVTLSTQKGTAVAGEDFTARTDEPVVITAGSLSETFVVQIIDDGIAENAEVFSVVITDVAGASIGDPSAVCDIADDDPVTLDVGDALAGEDDGMIVFRVAKTPAIARAVTFQIDTTAGTAGEGTDFVGVHTTLAIPADSTGADVQVGVLQDSLNETDETFLVQISAPSGLSVIGDGTGQGTIVDDDGLSVSIDDVLVDEDGGPAVFTLSLSGLSQQDLSLVVATQNGTAMAGADYVGQSDVAIIIPAGQASIEHDVVIINDAVTENTETFTLEITDGGGATILDGTGQASIVDDESMTISLTGVVVAEGDGTAVFVVTESPSIVQAVTFTFTTESGSATENVDFTGVSQEYTIPPGQTSIEIPVNIIDDTLFEATETFTATITASPDQANVGQGMALCGIVDDDPVTVTFEDESVTEGDGEVVFAFVLSGQAQPDIELTVSTEDGTAAADEDYTAQNGVVVTIAGGETTAQLSIPVLDDATAENAETFTLRLDDANFDTVVFGNTTAICTIVDDNDLVRLSVGDDVTVDEDSGTVSVTVHKLDPVAWDVNFRYGTVDGSATAGGDFTGVTNQLELIPAGSSSVQVQVGLINDEIHEYQESFQVMISGVAGQSTIVDAVADVTVTDDDALSVSGAAAIVDEGDGQADFMFTLNRASAVAQVMSFALSDQTAQADADYTMPGNPTFTFVAGETVAAAVVLLIDDAIAETVESFLLTLTDAADAVVTGPDAFDGVITDDDPVVLDVSDGEAGEAEDQVRFRVTKTPDIGRAASFDFDTGSGSAVEDVDFTGVHDVVTIPADSAGVFVDVPVIADGTPELTEYFQVQITNPSALAIVGDGTGTGGIVDDDVVPVTVSVDDPSAAEGDGSMVFTFTLSDLSAQDVELTLSTHDGSATAPGDYLAQIGEIATITAGEMTTTFAVPITVDGVAEADESFTLTIDDAQGAEIDDGTGQGDITDDDPLQLVISTVIATEDGGDTDLLRVVKSPAIARSVDFTVAFADGTAQAGDDYGDTGDAYTIAVGNPSFDVPLTILDDAAHDPDEIFTATVTATDPTEATSPAPYDITIVDDDYLAIAIADTSVVEHDGYAPIRIDLGRLSERDVVLTLSTENGTAEPGEDFTPWYHRVVTFTAPVQQDTVMIDVSHDYGSGDEVFYMRINDASGHTIIDDRATITILDDD